MNSAAIRSPKHGNAIFQMELGASGPKDLQLFCLLWIVQHQFNASPERQHGLPVFSHDSRPDNHAG